jgi:hypothetical protein
MFCDAAVSLFHVYDVPCHRLYSLYHLDVSALLSHEFGLFTLILFESFRAVLWQNLVLYCSDFLNPPRQLRYLVIFIEIIYDTTCYESS